MTMSTQLRSVDTATPKPSQEPEVRIKFDNVTVDFPTATGPMRVVDGVTLDIRDGEFVSIIGPRLRQDDLDEHRRRLRATHLRLRDAGWAACHGARTDRGVIFQEYGVFPWLTVRGNIEFGMKLAANKTSPRERAEICQRYMKLMGLSDFADHFPKHLSGGMRQRLAIARAYAVKPQFLLMDEPLARWMRRPGPRCRTCCSKCCRPRARR